MASFVKFYQFVGDIGLGVHNLNADILKIALTNVAPAQTDAVFADLTEIAPGHGYSAGGAILAVTSYGQVAGVGTLSASSDPVITASGGDIGPFRYAYLYNDTPTSPADPLIGYWDYGSSVTLHDGEPLTVDVSQVDGVLTLQ